MKFVTFRSFALFPMNAQNIPRVRLIFPLMFDDIFRHQNRLNDHFLFVWFSYLAPHFTTYGRVRYVMYGLLSTSTHYDSWEGYSECIKHVDKLDCVRQLSHDYPIWVFVVVIVGAIDECEESILWYTSENKYSSSLDIRYSHGWIQARRYLSLLRHHQKRRQNASFTTQLTLSTTNAINCLCAVDKASTKPQLEFAQQ